MAWCLSWFTGARGTSTGSGLSKPDPNSNSDSNSNFPPKPITSPPSPDFPPVAVIPQTLPFPPTRKVSVVSPPNSLQKSGPATRNKFLEILDGEKPKDFTGHDLDISVVDDEDVTSSLFAPHKDSKGFIEFLEMTLADFDQQNLPPDDPSVLKTQTMLAQELLNRTGRYQDSLDLSNSVLQCHQKSFGQSHEETLSIRLVYSYGLLYLTRHQEALKSFEEIDKIVREKIRDSEKEIDARMEQLSVSALIGMSSSLKMAGDCEDSLNILEQVYDMLIKAYRNEGGGIGEKTAEILSVQYSMARVLKKQGKLKEAKVMAQNAYRELNKCQIPQITPDDMNMIDFEHLLATLIRDDNGGNPNVAYGILMEIFRKEMRVLGANHPMTLSTILNFGILFERIGRTELAGIIFEKVYESRCQVLGMEHPKCGRVKCRLDNLKSGSGRNLNESEKIKYKPVRRENLI